MEKGQLGLGRWWSKSWGSSLCPPTTIRELHQRLHRLYQGSKFVEEYHKEMEILIIKANIEEDPKVTMAQFLGGLSQEIADVVELHHYVEMDDLVNMAMKWKGNNELG